MATSDSLVRKTFINLEEFLQKVAALDIFEALIFNYKIKNGLLDPLAIHFLTFVSELINQLQLLSQESNAPKDFLEVIPISVSHDANYNTSFDLIKPSEPCHQIPLVLSFCGDDCSDKTITPSNEGSKIKQEEPCEGDEVGSDVHTQCEASSETTIKVQKLACKRKKCEKEEKTEKKSRKQDTRLEKDKVGCSTRKCNKCEHCDRRFPTVTKLRGHQSKCTKYKAKVKNEGLTCEYCSLSFLSQKQLSSHISRNHTTVEDATQELTCRTTELQSFPENLPFFCCKFCTTVYKVQLDFESHSCKDNVSSAENGSGTRNCFQLMSKYLVTNPERLKLLRKYRCGLCQEEYRSMDRILYHLPRCTQGPYHCELCPEEYASKKDLNLHKKKFHRGTHCFFCDECGLPFKLRTSLQKHKVNRHETGQGSFTCDQCPKSFAKRVQLTNHMIRMHRLERKFLCQVCGNKFSTHGSLMSHLDTHGEKRRFPCSYCPKKFRQKEKLTYHIRIHTGERPHLCQTCGKGFIRKSKLDEHMRRHRGEKAHHCLLCNKSYASSWDLKVHNKKQHPKLNETSCSQLLALVPDSKEQDPDDPPPQNEKFILAEASQQPSDLSPMETLQPNPPTLTSSPSPDNNPNVLMHLNQTQPQGNDLVVPNSGTSDTSILVQLNAMPPTNQPAITTENVVENNRILVQLEPSHLQNNNLEPNSRILVQLNQTSQALVQGNDADGTGASRILVQLDPSQTQALLPPNSTTNDANPRILVQLDPTQQNQTPQTLPPNTILTVSDAIHLAPLVDNLNNLNMGGVTTQYIHLTSSQADTSTAATTGTANGMPLHIQLPVSALPVSALSQQATGTTAYELQSMSVQGHAGLVFTSAGFDVNSITY